MHTSTKADAVKPERAEAVGLQEAQQELDGQERGQRGAEARDERGATHAVALGAEQFGQLQRGGGEDHGGGEQEAVAGGVLVGEAGEQPAPHREAGAGDAGDQRGGLGAADRDRLAPAALGDARVGVAQVVAGLRGALAQPLEHEQGDPVDDQEGRGDGGGGEQFAQRFLQQQPEEPRGDGADHEQPPEPGVDVVLADLALPQRAQDAPDDLDPVTQEEQQQHDRGGEVGRNQEREEVGGGLVDVPAQ